MKAIAELQAPIGARRLHNPAGVLFDSLGGYFLSDEGEFVEAGLASLVVEDELEVSDDLLPEESPLDSEPPLDLPALDELLFA